MDRIGPSNYFKYFSNERLFAVSLVSFPAIQASYLARKYKKCEAWALFIIFLSFYLIMSLSQTITIATSPNHCSGG